MSGTAARVRAWLARHWNATVRPGGVVFGLDTIVLSLRTLRTEVL